VTDRKAILIKDVKDDMNFTFSAVASLGLGAKWTIFHNLSTNAMAVL
jgi:hypothetical protein